VVTYRTGTGRRLYMITSADIQPETVRCPADFTWIFTCNDEYINIKSHHLSSKEKACKNDKTWGWLGQWRWRKPRLLKNAKKIKCTYWLHVNQPQLLKGNIFLFFFWFWSLKVKYLCRCSLYFCKNTSLFTGGISTHKTSAVARTKYVWKFLALVRHRTMPGRCHITLIDLTNAVQAPSMFKYCLNYTWYRTISNILIENRRILRAAVWAP